MKRWIEALGGSLCGLCGFMAVASAAPSAGMADGRVAVGQASAELDEADRIVGVYYVIEDETGEESKIKIARDEDGTYYAQVVWMKNPDMPDGSPKLDFNNPDPALRTVRADQIKMMTGLEYNPKKQEWEHGKVYNPINGKMYKGYMTFVNDTKLKVRGYLGFSMLGRTMYWTKVE
ncbi:MAG: DUF2147 domain-containing protein [Bacteroidales bacterium]|nr:DUF2147 domain-containing protein [Bacteroidales bacterium]